MGGAYKIVWLRSETIWALNCSNKIWGLLVVWQIWGKSTVVLTTEAEHRGDTVEHRGTAVHSHCLHNNYLDVTGLSTLYRSFAELGKLWIEIVIFLNRFASKFWS